jgi:hypothetical protein
MSATAQPTPRPRRLSAARRDLLRERLVRETLDGRLLYSTDSQAVLAGRKTAEEIKGSSSLQ